MRYIYLLLITFIFAGCGNQKMRFVRTNTTKQKVVEINDIPSLKIKSETAFTPETIEENLEAESTSTSAADEESGAFTEEEGLYFPEVTSSPFPKSVQDSTTVSTAEARSIENEALRAERLGNWSFTLSLLYFLFALIAIIAIALALLSDFSPITAAIAILFGFMALASLIVSIILGAKSLNAAYNTPKGRNRAIIGIVISSAVLGLFLFTLGFSFF